MSDREDLNPENRPPTDGTQPYVRTEPASGSVRLRRGPTRAVTPTRVGTVVVVAVLLLAAAVVARTPLDPAAAGASSDPGATAPAATMGPTQPPAESFAALPTETEHSPAPTDEPAPSPAPTDPAELTPAPTDGPGSTGGSGPTSTPAGAAWTSAPMDGFAASVEVVSVCMNSRDHADTLIRVSWDGTVPVDKVLGEFNPDDGFDELEGSGDGGGQVSGSYDVTMTFALDWRQEILFQFFAEEGATLPDGAGPGLFITEIGGGALLFHPTNPCP